MIQLNLVPEQLKINSQPREIKILEVSFSFNRYNLSSWDKMIVDMISNTKGVWCAGGAPLAMYMNRPNQINDWDIFVEDKPTYFTVQRKLLNMDFHTLRREGFLDEWEKGDGLNSRKVQLITKHMEQPTNFIQNEFITRVLADFDISVCQVGFKDLSSIFITQDAIDDINKKSFRLFKVSHKTEERILKYKNKGFDFDESSRDSAIISESLY